MTLNFYLRFSTHPGQALFVYGNNLALGNNDIQQAIPLQYLNNEFWQARLEIANADFNSFDIEYRYLLREEDGNQVIEWGNDRIIGYKKNLPREMVLIDTWNHAGDVQNAFYTKPFQQVLLKNKSKQVNLKSKPARIYTHEFKVKAPLLKEDEVLCISGSGVQLKEWNIADACCMSKKDPWWVIKLDFTNETFPIAYKYGVYNTSEKSFQYFETGINRMVSGDAAKDKVTVLHDGFAQLAFSGWKGAGVAIPVFSLRSSNGFGTGEFADLKLLVDWANITGLKLIQLLPVNDTTATHTFLDSYPYAAISAFALHPLYINLNRVADNRHHALVQSLQKKQNELNQLKDVDYEQVMKYKFSVLKELFIAEKETVLNDIKYFEFFDLNRHWLVPYAAFCYLRDKYNTADYNQWETGSIYDETAIQQLASPGEEHYDSIALHYFIQYHLHLQLKEATAYAHTHGIIVKGDLPIGIYRYGCDAWMAPGLYNMDAQAGAPPDDFAVKGQNWGFPTYNWKRMQQDGFAWWRRRFEQMSEYFDAFRIDHILGFFRIWSIPLHAVEGIMGRFVPAIPIDIKELKENWIAFDHDRYCKPYITSQIILEFFGMDADHVKKVFLDEHNGRLSLKKTFDTQRKVEKYFAEQPPPESDQSIKYGLFDLISNVIFFEEQGVETPQYHFRINMDQTSSYRYLDGYTKHKLKDLYINYFFRRQDDFWKKEAMNKLPELKRSTNMLVCGEDLGMVPACVPDVMQQLGMLSLEIQRMPKDDSKEFFHPADAPYLSVVTPSTHDMSTIRGWWEEDIARTQRFYNDILGHYGSAPFYCEAWINKEILVQHLYSPAMWAIFQLQDILGMDEKLRRENPQEERINVPADPKHYWKYRMHLWLEDLVNQSPFNEGLKEYVIGGGR